jgi:transposase
VYNFFLDYEIEKSRKWRSENGKPPRAPKVLKTDKQKLRFDMIKKLLALSVNHGKVLTALKKVPEFAWLNEVNSQVLKSSVEDLEDAFKRMKKVGSGFPRFKRKGVKAKSSLNREMLRLGLGLVRQRTEQKCREFDRVFKLIDARYTSQTCNVCGCVSKLNRKSQAVFECIECGHSANADANAALNIASRALAA